MPSPTTIDKALEAAIADQMEKLSVVADRICNLPPSHARLSNALKACSLQDALKRFRGAGMKFGGKAADSYDRIFTALAELRKLPAGITAERLASREFTADALRAILRECRAYQGDGTKAVMAVNIAKLLVCFAEFAAEADAKAEADAEADARADAEADARADARADAE